MSEDSEIADENPRRRRDDGWHIAKALDLSHLLTTILIVVGGLTAYNTTISDLDKRLALLEQSQTMQTEIRTDVRSLKNQMGPLISKLDSYIDQNNETDNRQWDRINDLAREVGERSRDRERDR